MAKRKLTQQQQQRIQQRQATARERLAHAGGRTPGPDEADLSPAQEGLIISHFGQKLEVEALDGDQAGQRFRCHARANLGPMVTGDRVVWRAGREDEGVVEAVHERRSLLSRPDKFGKLKPVAANIDRIGIVLAAEPEPFPNLIDRYLVAAELSDIEPLLILNKADLTAGRDDLTLLLHRYERLGYCTLRVSALRQNGLDDLRSQLAGHTSVLVGQSGVGKSSLIQALLPQESIKVGDLSEGMAKGTHTTTTARLYHLPGGGDLVDSPGIREFGLWHIDEADLCDGFREFRPHLGTCRFRDCTHFQDPGCALTAAVKQGEITAERRDSYLQIRESLGEIEIRG